MDFHKLSYSLHEKGHLEKDKLMTLELYQNWFDNGTVDIWRHLRMFSLIDPLLEEFKGASWLTVGDGTYGTASIYIKKKGGHALPIDLHVSLLEIAKENGMIISGKRTPRPSPSPTTLLISLTARKRIISSRALSSLCTRCCA